MRLVEQWAALEPRLREGAAGARFLLTTNDDRRAARASALLAPLHAGRNGKEVRFSCAVRGPGPRPETAARLIRHLDREHIAGRLEIEELLAAPPEPDAEAEPDRPLLVPAWDGQVGKLPPDWSDLYAEVALRSGGHLDRAALLMAPLNPGRFDASPAFRFRSARRFGYGASPGMVRRCLERLDSEGVEGSVTILFALSDTDPVGTQGPVWYLGGRPV